MEWYQVFTIIISIGGIVFWIWREMKTDMRNNMNEIRADMREFRQDVKDFHGRLCALEEKYYQIDRKK